MPVKPMPYYFLVRIAKKEQEERSKKIGVIIIPDAAKKMRFHMQTGEIMAIGSKAAIEFPEAELGMWLIFHHFVESKDKSFLVDTDDKYNYYVVTSIAINGENNHLYGVWDEEKIITHKDTIILENDPPPINYLMPDEYLNAAVEKTSSGLVVFKNWKETRERKGERMAHLKAKNEQLARYIGTEMERQIKEEIERNEREMNDISRSINKPSFAPFTIAYFNPILESKEWFNRPINRGDVIYCQDNAANTKVLFNGQEYRTVKTRFIGFMTV